MPRRSAVTLRWISVAGLFAATLAAGLYVARPVHSASIGFDSQVAVLDFSRLLAGRHVEVFLATTPKPLLTFIFGPLELLSHDWRTLAWATMLAFGLGVVLAAELARRIGGTLAWAFVGVGLAGSGALLFDVGYALAIPWALLGWSSAGLAVSLPQPRYGLAGIALLLASLARLETLLIVGVAALVLLILAYDPIKLVAEGRGIQPPPKRAWLILVALAALPIMGLHDLLIYGDPLFWVSVPARYSAVTSRPILTAPELLSWLLGRYLGLWPLVLLALAGVARLLHDRHWAVVAGLAALGPGMAGFLLFLAIRHIEVPDRYAAPIDLALILAGGIGAAWLLAAAARRFGPRVDPGAHRAGLLTAGASMVLAVGLAVLATWPGGILDSGLTGAVRTSLALAADVDQMVPTLRGIVDGSSLARLWPDTISQTSDGSTPSLLLVPLPYRPRLSVDLDAPLTTVGAIVPNRFGLPGTYPAVGQFVAHDRRADGTYSAFAWYETTLARVVGQATITPVAADPARLWWITRIDAAQ